MSLAEKPFSDRKREERGFLKREGFITTTISCYVRMGCPDCGCTFGCPSVSFLHSYPAFTGILSIIKGFIFKEIVAPLRYECEKDPLAGFVRILSYDAPGKFGKEISGRYIVDVIKFRLNGSGPPALLRFS